MYFFRVLEPVMLANEIDAYIAGHDHSMQHIYYTNRTGHDYIISAGGGRGEMITSSARVWAEVR